MSGGVVTNTELRKAETRHQRAMARAQEARQLRNQVIAAAVADGWTQAQIARATGLTRGRVGQLAMAFSKDVA